MTDRKWQIGKVQIIWHPSGKLLKTLVITLIAFSTAALAALWWVRADIRHQTEKMRAEAAFIISENQKLESRLSDMTSIQSVLKIAEDELGMVSENTILIKPQS